MTNEIKNLATMNAECSTSIGEFFIFKLKSYEKIKQVLNPDLESTVEKIEELYLQKTDEVNANYKLGSNHFTSISKTCYDKSIKKYF